MCIISMTNSSAALVGERGVDMRVVQTHIQKFISMLARHGDAKVVDISKNIIQYVHVCTYEFVCMYKYACICLCAYETKVDIYIC